MYYIKSINGNSTVSTGNQMNILIIMINLEQGCTAFFVVPAALKVHVFITAANTLATIGYWKYACVGLLWWELWLFYWDSEI